MKHFLESLEFKALASSLFEGVILSNSEGIITYVNKVTLHFFPKLSTTDLVGKPVTFLIHSRDLELFLVNKTNMRNIAISIGMNQLLANFKYIDSENLLIVLKNITNLQNILQDLNEANNQIRLFHSILDKVDEGVCFIDNNQKIIFYNSKMGEFDSKEPEGLREETYGTVFPKATYKIDPFLHSLVNEKKIIQNESYFSNSGKKYTVQKINEPLYLGNRKIGALSLVRDFTKLEKLMNDMLRTTAKDNRVPITPEKVHPQISSSNNTMKKIIKETNNLSNSFSNVLIYGEKGVGKNLIADYITHPLNMHSNNTPFYSLNCGAVPEHLLEEILFGKNDTLGLLACAKGGTILLDEVNAMSTSLQERLLRVLENGKLHTGSKEILINIRIISLMNERPEVALKNKRLLEDLFYQLAVVTIHIPPLRDRKDDIPTLLNHFIELYGSEAEITISDDTLNILLKYHFPGNVRQLKYIVEGAITRLQHTHIIEPNHLPSYVVQPLSSDRCAQTGVRNIVNTSQSLTEQVESLEKEIITKTLENTNFHITNAADKLGITRQSLNYKLKKYNITIWREER